MIQKKHIGSTFESFLEEEGTLDEVSIAALKAIISNSIKKEIEEFEKTKPSDIS
jgi:hypothetical protein